MIKWDKKKRDQGERAKTIEKNKVKKENQRKKNSKNDLVDNGERNWGEGISGSQERKSRQREEGDQVIQGPTIS